MWSTFLGTSYQQMWWVFSVCSLHVVYTQLILRFVVTFIALNSVHKHIFYYNEVNHSGISFLISWCVHNDDCLISSIILPSSAGGAGPGGGFRWCWHSSVCDPAPVCWESLWHHEGQDKEWCSGDIPHQGLCWIIRISRLICGTLWSWSLILVWFGLV